MEVHLTSDAIKQYRRLPKSDSQKINKKLLQLQENPFSGKKLSGELAGSLSLKAWPYRIIYNIDVAGREIWVLSILHRQGAYKH
jgi:mRNA-degrading endonuclease RelE of RelBE toxin-antitoxin system